MNVKQVCRIPSAIVLVAMCVISQNSKGWTYTVSNGEAMVGGGSPSTPAIATTTKGEIAIPSTLGGFPVTAIAPYAFYNCTNITSVTVPSSITQIGKRAFWNCNALTGVLITDLTAWCRISFSDWSSNPLSHAHQLYINRVGYSRLTIPDDVESISDYAFYGYDGFNNLAIPDSVTSIGEDAFMYCRGLANVTFGNGLTNIGTYAFCGCAKLTNLTLPNSVTKIGVGAFTQCSNIKSIQLPFVGAERGNTGKEGLLGYIFGPGRTLQYYSSDNYYECDIPSALTTVVITDENRIGYGAFYNCTKVTSITIPGSVTKIENFAFYNCRGLTSMTMPSGVSKIGKNAFEGCSGLKSVHVSDVSAWCNISFGSFSSNPLYYAHDLYLDGEKVSELEIPSGTTSIGAYAFSDCSSLTKVTIPRSVNSIGGNAF